jgi:hypothetical protein
MRQSARFLGFFLLLCTLSPASLAVTYVITNDNNTVANSATVYELNTTTGTLTLVKVLLTNGVALGGVSFDAVGQAVTQTANCVFILDSGSSDIAAFSRATGYEKVGNYSDSAVLNGASIALSPNGKWLYGTYIGTVNLGAWRVNADCSLTFIAAYTPSVPVALSDLKVTPNNLGLVVPLTNFEAAEGFRINPDGTLTDLGFVSFKTIPQCELDSGCFPFSVDITKDSRVAVFGSTNGGGNIPVAITVNLTSAGLTDPEVWQVGNPVNANGSVLPFFSAAGYAGSGFLYFGVCGPGAGVTTTSFAENPLNIEVVTTTLVDPARYDGAIAVTGTTMVIAEPPNQIGVFRTNADGSITPLSTVTDPNSSDLISLSIFPNTR